MERLTKIGNVKPKHAKEVPFSRLGVGFEKLDRNAFDPSKAYDKIAATGVKWVRIQSGWQRTEKEKGVYDWAWIDDVIGNLYDRGMQPWVCLCYGNEIYTEAAKHYYGAVGVPPIHTEEERQGWANYVTAFVERYKGKVEYFEVWNEPDWCWRHSADRTEPDVSGTEYGNFVIATADAIKKGNPDAKVIGGSICVRSMNFFDEALKTGMGKYIDALTFHEYTSTERDVAERVRILRGILDAYGAEHVEIIQGESGSQSRSGGHGALWRGAWTPRKQAKELLRHAMADLFAGVKFTSYFSCMDMQEALNGVPGDVSSILDFGYFGVLGAEFDEKGFATGEYTPKPSYYALSNLASMFSGEMKLTALPVLRIVNPSDRIFGSDCTRDFDIFSGGFKRPDGSMAYVYWKSSDLMTSEFDGTGSFEISSTSEVPKLVDLLDGSIYEIPDSMIEKYSDTCFLIKNLPLRDYPLALVFGDFGK